MTQIRGEKQWIPIRENLSVGHFSPIVSERHPNPLQEYVFHFTKTGSVKIDKLRVGVTYQDKTNIGRWKSATCDKRDRGNVWLIPHATIQEGRPHPAVFPVKYLNAALNCMESNQICLYSIHLWE